MKISGYILILISLSELIIFIEIGSYIGSLNVILWIFLTIFIGIYLIKSKLRSIKFSLFNIRSIQDIQQQYTTDIYSLLAGILLIVPGFLTDTLGFFLLLPFIKPMISKYVKTDNKKADRNSLSELLDKNFHDEEIDKRSLSELRNKFDELNSMNWNNMTKAQKDLREKIVKKIQSSYNS